ncbi:MAG: hypothetical protein JNK72_21285 [Myxococcales bacterium]|nr:hypothetical protein [Myxococcales bacterium]
MTRPSRVLGAVALGLMLGCGDTTGGGGGGALTIADFPARYYAAICGQFFRCPQGGDSGLVVALLGDEARCVSMIPNLAGPQIADLVAAVNRGTVRFDGAAAARCLSQVSSSCMALEGDGVTECRSAFTGTLAAGAGCWRNEECSTGNYCDHGDAAARICPGMCRAVVAAGGACSSDRQCAGWSTGAEACLNSRCVAVTQGPTAQVGQACGTSDASPSVHTACAAGLACVNRTCQTPAAAGAPCSDSIVCAPGLVCAGNGGTMRNCQSPSNLITSTAGGACRPGGQQPPICNPLQRLACGDSNTCMTVGDGSAGSRCIGSADFGSPCNAGLYCERTTNLCTAQRATGAECTSGRQCASGDCQSGRCLERICE